MLFEIVTALPGIVEPVLQQSILKRAVDKDLARVQVHDLREFAAGPHRQVDDYPFGGGAGMVLKPEPIFACIEQLEAEAQRNGEPIDEIIYLTPDGDRFDQRMANAISMKRHVVLLAGHYKGIDQRVRDELVTREISVGDYVLSGGELPALILVDAVIRLIPGVLSDATSALTDSFQDDLLDAPAYTRPAIFRGLEVPSVLRSGDHSAISAWRESERVKKTTQRRPELMNHAQHGDDLETTHNDTD